MSSTVLPQDPRFQTLERGNNRRFPASAADTASRIEVCRNADEAAESLQKAVRAGLRPTVKSGGHCYEDFVVNNPGGVILDLSLLTDSDASGSGHTYKVSTGTHLGDAYNRLYKEYGVTLPGDEGGRDRGPDAAIQVRGQVGHRRGQRWRDVDGVGQLGHGYFQLSRLRVGWPR